MTYPWWTWRKAAGEQGLSEGISLTDIEKNRAPSFLWMLLFNETLVFTLHSEVPTQHSRGIYFSRCSSSMQMCPKGRIASTFQEIWINIWKMDSYTWNLISEQYFHGYFWNGFKSCLIDTLAVYLSPLGFPNIPCSWRQQRAEGGENKLLNLLFMVYPHCLLY